MINGVGNGYQPSNVYSQGPTYNPNQQLSQMGPQGGILFMKHAYCVV